MILFFVLVGVNWWKCADKQQVLIGALFFCAMQVQQTQYQQMMEVLQKQQRLAQLQRNLQEGEQNFQRIKEEKMLARELRRQQRAARQGSAGPRPSSSARLRPSSSASRPGTSSKREPSGPKTHSTEAGKGQELAMWERFARQTAEWEEVLLALCFTSAVGRRACGLGGLGGLGGLPAALRYVTSVTM